MRRLRKTLTYLLMKPSSAEREIVSVISDLLKCCFNNLQWSDLWTGSGFPFDTQLALFLSEFLDSISHCLQHRQSAAATFSSTSSSGCTTIQPQHTWPSVILCRRSYRLELASRRSPRSRLYRKHIQTVAEDIFFAQH